MRVLVTGATGFAGGHLAEALLARPDVELLGVSRRGRWPAEWQQLEGRCALRACDMLNTQSVEGVLTEWKPNQIYHLAGYAHVGRSFREPDAAWNGNLGATRSLYDAVQHLGGTPRILYVGSGLVYGEPEIPGNACDERCLLRPDNPYAASKAAADLLSYQVWRSTGLDIVLARPFNHIGPRQSSEYAVGHFARQLAEIERGGRPSILETGNLRPIRDLSDVRDTVRGYMLIMERGRAGEAYNLGGGNAYSMQEILDRLLAQSDARVDVRQRKDLMRQTEPAALRADAGKARQELGWNPGFSLDQTLADTLAYWRRAL